MTGQESMCEATTEQSKDRSHWGTWVWIAGSVLIALALVLVEVMHTRDRITIGNLDYFVMVSRARQLPNTLSAWVNGMYPVGIPLIARLGLALGTDVMRAGQAASILGGVLSLYGGALLAWHLTRSQAFSLLVMLTLLATGALLFYSGFEGTDMLSGGLLALALGILSGGVEDRKTVAVTGVVIGLAYLIRYTALMTAMICAAYLLALALARRERCLAWNALWFIACFLVAASPQLISSMLAKGNPFYQTQAYHIWAKLYANSDFISTARTAPYEITPWRLFWLDPERFITNWLGESRKFWLTLVVPLVDQPLVQVARAGWLFIVLAESRVMAKQRALVGWFVLGSVEFLSIFTVDTRFLLLLIPTFVVCGAYFLWRIVPARVRLGPVPLPLNTLVLAVLALALLPRTLAFAHASEGGPHAQVIEISNIMHAAGMQTATDTISSNLYHQDAASPARDRFLMLYRFDAPQALEDFRRAALAAGHHFIVYDDHDGVRYHPQYQDLLVPETRPKGFTPVWISPERATIGYRIEPDTPQPQVPLEQTFSEQITLLGYDVYQTPALPQSGTSLVGVYLYWQAAQPVERSFKVFVHLMDTDGNLVVQHDSAPALWTYRTWDWQPGEIVVDFHTLYIPPEVPAGIYTLFTGLYDEETGVRLPLRGTLGPGSDATSVTLAQITRGVQR